MGLRSLAEKIFEEYEEEEPGEDTWLIIYDFPRIKPAPKFYDNLNRIKNIAENGQLLQYSVYMTRDQRAAKATRDLVKRYDGQSHDVPLKSNCKVMSTDNAVM